MLYLVYVPVTAFTNENPDHLMMLFLSLYKWKNDGDRCQFFYIGKCISNRCQVYSSWCCISAQEQQYDIRPSPAAIQLSDRQCATKGCSDQQAERTHC